MYVLGAHRQPLACGTSVKAVLLHSRECRQGPHEGGTTCTAAMVCSDKEQVGGVMKTHLLMTAIVRKLLRQSSVSRG
jgi:hypothetical protein